eukprot:TRINITY_DN270_c0_g1_i2.p1 TRINITY_DN270_c0_g1~~TRINITY_DN270_c0_g1_i2.p1  ORF type:complete len:287 (+),score=97.23 TRINITY_DN270_c0_g1_i2:150-1010(+)
MVDVHTGTVVAHLQDAHEAAVNKLFCYDDFLVSGDDDGCIKIWDLKKKTCTQTFEDNEDFISAFTISEDRKFLLATSGDGTLAVYNLRKGKLHIRSQNLEDELLSILIVKDGRKVVCGSQGGILNLFNWGEFGDFSDRFPGHPFSIDTMVKIDEDTIATGSSDGLIRVVGILPNKMLGVIGDHEDFPVEKLSVSYDKRFMASCSHDCLVKFWDVKYLFDDQGGDEEGGEEGEGEGKVVGEGEGDAGEGGEEAEVEEGGEETVMVTEAKKKKKKKTKRSKKKFFSDL